MGTKKPQPKESAKSSKPRSRPEKKTSSNTDDIPDPPGPWRGSRVTTAKFDEEEIRTIRKMHEKGWSIRSLALRYKTTWNTMSAIVKRKSWAHVK